MSLHNAGDVNPLALPVIALDPLAIMGAKSEAGTPSNPLASAFAELLKDAEGSAVAEEEKPRGVKLDTPLIAPSFDETAVAPEPKDPEGIPDSTPQSIDERAALAYASVAQMPAAPLPTTDTPADAPQPVALPRVAGITVKAIVEEAVEPEARAAFSVQELPVPESKRSPTAEREAHSSEVSDAPVSNAPVPEPPESPGVGPNLVAPAPIAPPPAPSLSAPQAQSERPHLGLVPAPPIRLEAAVAPPQSKSQPEPVILEARITQKPSLSPENAKTDLKRPKKLETFPSTPEHLIARQSEPRANSVAPLEPIKAATDPEPRPEAGEPDPTPAVIKAAPPAEFAPGLEIHQQTERPGAPRVTAPEPAPRAATPIPEDTPATSSRAPLKQMDLRIPDANGGVTIRLKEREGSLHVSVRSADTQVASKVVERLPELGANLDRQGFHSETWTAKDGPLARTVAAVEALTEPLPMARSAETATEARLEARHASPATQASEPSHAGNKDPNDDHRRPEWLEEMNKRPKRPTEENFQEYL